MVRYYKQVCYLTLSNISMCGFNCFKGVFVTSIILKKTCRPKKCFIFYGEVYAIRTVHLLFIYEHVSNMNLLIYYKDV